MNINNNIINEYFDCNLEWNDDIPKISIKLKDMYKFGKNTPFRPNVKNRIPYSGIQIEYYIHYFGDTDLAKSIHEERKKLSSKHSQLRWWLSNNKLDQNTINKIENYLYNVGNLISDKLKLHYNSDAGLLTKEKLQNRSKKWSGIIGKMNSDRWKDSEWRSTEMKRRADTDFYSKVADKNRNRMSDPEYYEKFMKSVKSQSRIEKISKSAKEMWIRMKRDKPSEYYKIINAGPNKNFQLNGYNMNMLEYLMGNTLNDMGMDWEYEKDFDFNGIVYIPDFYIPKYNLIVECYGDYWHANPTIYSSGDVIFKNVLVDVMWERDDIRMNTFKVNGYSFLSFWETDIKNNIDKVKNKICQII